MFEVMTLAIPTNAYGISLREFSTKKALSLLGGKLPQECTEHSS